MIFGELRVVDDVADSFARLVTEAAGPVVASGRRFRLGCSGGASGAACFAKLATEQLAWSSVECYFADERCVDESSPDRNAVTIAAALGARRGELAGYHAMSCEEGPDAYASLIAEAGGFDLLQLGVGPDGHTASLFPSADGSDAPPDALVIRNADPTGRNKFDRLSLTFAAIELARVVVITAIGEDKADVLRRVADGEDLPLARVRAGEVIWLADRGAAAAVDARASE